MRGQVAEEADEAVYWIERLINGGFVSAERVKAMLQEGKELRSIFAASYKTARRPKKRATPPDQ